MPFQQQRANAVVPEKTQKESVMYTLQEKALSSWASVFGSPPLARPATRNVDTGIPANRDLCQVVRDYVLAIAAQRPERPDPEVKLLLKIISTNRPNLHPPATSRH